MMTRTRLPLDQRLLTLLLERPTCLLRTLTERLFPPAQHPHGWRRWKPSAAADTPIMLAVRRRLHALGIRTTHHWVQERPRRIRRLYHQLHRAAGAATVRPAPAALKAPRTRRAIPISIRPRPLLDYLYEGTPKPGPAKCLACGVTFESPDRTRFRRCQRCRQAWQTGQIPQRDRRTER